MWGGGGGWEAGVVGDAGQRHEGEDYCFFILNFLVKF
jgi:hypothetical protein